MSSKASSPEFKVGLYVITITCLALFLIIYIGIKKDLFSQRVTYYVISTTGENVERGIPVRLSGFKIGQVTEVDLDNVDYVKIEIDILERYEEWFTRDAQIILVQGGFIGQTYLKLLPGASKGSPVLEPGAVIELNKVGGLDEILAEAEPVLRELRVIVHNIKEITDLVLAEAEPVHDIIANVEKVSRDVASDKGLVAYLTSNPEPVAKLERLLEHTDRTVQDIGLLAANATTTVQDLKPMQEEVQTLVGEVRQFVKELNTMSKQLDPAVKDVTHITSEVRRATRDLSRLRDKSEYTIRLGTELLQRLKETWPLARQEDFIRPPDQPVP